MKVLIVEDSRVVSLYIRSVLQQEPDFEVVDTINNGLDAVNCVCKKKPDIVLMDIHLPGEIDGLEAIKRIMTQNPCPIVVLSNNIKGDNVDMTFESLRAGAVDVMAKPQGLGVDDQETFRKQLTRTLRVMVQVKVIRHREFRIKSLSKPDENINHTTRKRLLIKQYKIPSVKLLAIGASTGGATVIFDILQQIPSLPIPTIISQHIVAGFEEGLCLWFRKTGHKVKLVEKGDVIEKGCIYILPAGIHLELDKNNVFVEKKISLGIIPNIDILFSSVAKFYGESTCGVLLSGMGKDGSLGFKTLKEAGAITIAQLPETCVISSMPIKAIEAKAVTKIMTPHQIAIFLKKICLNA